MGSNLILQTDSYKLSHYLQYPPGVDYASAYLEARRGAKYAQTLFFGLQYILQKHLCNPINQADIAEAAGVSAAHGLPFNAAGWRAILNEHDGYLPIEIYSPPEGSLIPEGNALLRVENTAPGFHWLVTYVETLLMQVWYPTTVASLDFEAKQIIKSYLEATCDNPAAELLFKLHDFGYRGSTSEESAGIGGCAHLVNFRGTDTLAALRVAKDYYGCQMAGFSIPAAEHSTITSWCTNKPGWSDRSIERDGEARAFANMLTQFGGKGKLVAVVSDSYDVDFAVDELWGRELRQRVLDMGGTLVIRPDSGDPVEVVPRLLTKLRAAFGTEKNKKGYWVLNPAVRLIQGDGMNLASIRLMLQAVKDAGFSTENVAMGMGAGLLQQVQRDDQRMAYKVSAVREDGFWRDVYKEPRTDPTKRSRGGRQHLVTIKGAHGTGYQTVRQEDLKSEHLPAMRCRWRNGQMLRWQSLDEVRALVDRQTA